MDFYNFNVKSNFDLKWTMTASSLESDCSLLRRFTLQLTVFLSSRVVFSTKKARSNVDSGSEIYIRIRAKR